MDKGQINSEKSEFMAADNNDVVLDAIMALVPPLLEALEALGFVARHMHPPHLDGLLAQVAGADEAMQAGRAHFASIDWPDDLAAFRAQVELVADEVTLAFEGLRAAQADPNGIMVAYRGLRHLSRAAEALYPISAMLPPVSPYFVEPQARGDKELAAKLADADMGREDAGLRHMSNEKHMRGGFSVYVPETYDATDPAPLIIAMHGGSGHGRDFLWTWLAYVAEQWNIDRERIMLTGMSDGGTFSYVLGLQSGAPFTHLAPVAASFHPFLIEMADPERVKDLPIYITHGALDWMFDADMARVANRTMTGAGARVTYREIEDLSHTYPRDENPRIMDWFLLNT